MSRSFSSSRRSLRLNFRLKPVLQGLLAAFALLAALTSCTKSQDGNTDLGKKSQLNLAIWGNYLSPETRARFTRETGIELRITHYSSNEELLAKVQSGASGLDVAVPSDYMVDVMGKLGLLEQLDHELLPARKNIAPEFLDQAYDPKNQLSLPYAWATAGIAINRELFKGSIKSWKDFFENPELTGKIALLDDVREVAAAALKLHGHSVNSINPQELEAAKNSLLKLRPRVKMFTSNSIDILKNREVLAAQTYSMDALQASAQTGGKIEYILPLEGGTRSIDNLVILKGAKNREAAYAFFNFLLQPDVNLDFVTRIRGGPVVKGVRDKLPDELRQSASLFPEASTLKRLERLTDLGEKNRLYEDLWSAVKAAR